MKKLSLFLLLLLFAVTARAQNSTTVTINVTDSGGVAWNSGTYKLTFVGPANANWPGGAISPTLSGNLNTSGSATQSTPNNNTITPSPSFWTVQVCPNPGLTVSSGCFILASQTITGAAQTLTITPPAISILGATGLPVAAYADAEIVAPVPLGFIYFQFLTTTTGTYRQCQGLTGTACTTWANVGAAGTGTVTTTGSPVSGNLTGFSGTTSITAASGDEVSDVMSCVAASGSGTTYTCTTAPTFVPAAGDMIFFEADVANTGAAVLNVNGSGAVSIKKQGGSVLLAANDFLAGQEVILIFDGTCWQMQGQLGNAPTTGAVTSVTGTANQISSTGGATPVLSITSPFDPPGSVAVTGPSPWIDITAPTYGAKCDDVTLDDAALDSAIAAVPTGAAGVSGATIFIPATCKFSSTHVVSKPNITFKGPKGGFQLTVANLPATYLDYTGTQNFFEVDAQGVEFKDLGIKAPNLAGSVTPTAPTLSLTGSGGTLSATENFKVTYINNFFDTAYRGESYPSAEASIGSIGTNCVTVTSPGASGNAAAYNVYMSSNSNFEVKQNSSPILLGTNLQICASTNLGVPPVLDTTAQAAVFDYAAIVNYDNIEIFTGNTGVYGTGGNGITSQFSGPIIRHSRISGFSVGMNWGGSNNGAQCSDLTTFERNGWDIVDGGGAAQAIHHCNFQLASTGHIKLLASAGVQITGENYFEQNAPNSQPIVQVGDSTVVNRVGGVLTGPVNVEFTGNYINCTSTSWANGQSPIEIQQLNGTVHSPIRVINNSFSSCGNQYIINNTEQDALSTIWISQNTQGTTFNATGCAGAQCGWLTNAGSATGALTGVIYDDNDPVGNISLRPTTPQFTNALNLGVSGVNLGSASFAGSTSGTATVQSQAVAGTPTLTLPNTNGTFADGASAPLALSATSGNLSITGITGIQGTDTNLMSAGTVSGTAASLCTDANGGATTTGCPSGSPALSSVTNPVTSTTFTFPATNTLLFNGTAPAAANPGTASGTLFTVTAPVGGAALSGNNTGGSGGNLALTTGAGGASTGTAANANGGAFTLIMGAAGTGGSGAAGTPGAFLVKGTNSYTFGDGTVNQNFTLNGPSLNNVLRFQEASVTKASIFTQTGALVITTGGNNAMNVDTSQLLTVNKTIKSYNGLTTAGEGVPVIVGTATQVGQTVAISDTTLFTVGAATTLFHFSGTVNCTTSSAAATATLNLKYTDSASTAQTVSVTDTCTSLVTSGIPNIDVALRAKTGTVITYGVTIANTPTYDVDVALEQLHQ